MKYKLELDLSRERKMLILTNKGEWVLSPHGKLELSLSSTYYPVPVLSARAISPHPQFKSRLEEFFPWQREPQAPHTCPVLWIFEKGLLGIVPTDLTTVLMFELTLLQIPTEAYIHKRTVLGWLTAPLVKMPTPWLLEVPSR